MASLVIALAALQYALSTGQEIKRVTPSGEIEFYSTGQEISAEQIQPRQDELERRVSHLEQEAKATSESEVVPGASAHLSGNWIGGNGLTYAIEQYGAQVAIQEITPSGITAVGQGTVAGDSLNLNYQSLDGSYGRAVFSIDGDRLVGSFNNASAGYRYPPCYTGNDSSHCFVPMRRLRPT